MKEIDSIKGKKILFLAPAFFGYENKIQEKLEEIGASVDFYNERSVTKAIDRALLKIIPSIFNKKTKAYYRDILIENRDKKYDYIFIVKCEMVTKEVLIDFRTAFPNARFCLYLWDSVENIKGIENKFKYFDRVLSFDLKDVERYSQIKFRPLFYIDDFKKEAKNVDKYKYDISFCGTIHSDRYAIIKEILDVYCTGKLNHFFYCYLQSSFIYYIYKLIKPEFKKVPKSEIAFTKLSSVEISDIVENSRVILDIQHPKQSGLTMRTIEMIGMNKKLITTNTEIKKYDFYNPSNILIVDRKKIEIPKDFFESDYISLETDIYEKYSLNSWIKDILKDSRVE